MFCFFSFNVYLSSKEGKADFGFSLFHKSARKDYLEAQFLGESLGYIAMPHYLLIDILLPFLVNFIKATLYTHPALPLPVAYIKPSRTRYTGAFYWPVHESFVHRCHRCEPGPLTLGSNTTSWFQHLVCRSYPEATLRGAFVSEGPPQGLFLPPPPFILPALGIWSFGTVVPQGLKLFPGLGTRKVINFEHHILVGKKS